MRGGRERKKMKENSARGRKRIEIEQNKKEKHKIRETEEAIAEKIFQLNTFQIVRPLTEVRTTGAIAGNGK